jgi:hypothetical protein
MTAVPSPVANPAAFKWTGWALSGLFIAFMIFDVGIKLAGVPQVAETLTAMGWPAGLGLTIGIIELVCLVLYAIPRTAVLGAVLITAVLGGAVATHLRIASPLFSHVLFGVYLGLFAWGGLWLRTPALRALFPFRR